MNLISKDAASKFCELCNWAYECWVTHERLGELLGNIGPNYFTPRLSAITQEYTLLQICKLHDPAIQSNSLNLTIEYFVKYGDWGTETSEIQELVSKLKELLEKIKPARNKILAHNDLEIILKDQSMGEFPDGLDRDYFSVLQELANKIHVKWVGGPYVFNDLAKADVDEFIQKINSKQ